MIVQISIYLPLTNNSSKEKSYFQTSLFWPLDDYLASWNWGLTGFDLVPDANLQLVSNFYMQFWRPGAKINTEGTVQYSTELETQPTINFKASKVQFYLKITVSALVAEEQRNSSTFFFFLKASFWQSLRKLEVNWIELTEQKVWNSMKVCMRKRDFQVLNPKTIDWLEVRRGLWSSFHPTLPPPAEPIRAI